MPYINQDHNDATRQLARLIARRLHHPETSAETDREIWERFGETHAILFTDLAGFSRGVEAFGILHFLQLIYESEILFGELVQRRGGHVIKVEADSMLAVFPDAIRAAEAAVDMHRESERRNTGRAPENCILVCVGIGYGRILNLGFADVYGSEVNAASKLGEDIARSGEILVTGAAAEALEPAGYRLEPISEVPSGAQRAFRLHWAG